MRRNLVQNLLFLALAVGLITGSLVEIHTMSARANQNVRATLPGQANPLPLLQHARILHAANPNQTLQLSLGLRPRNPSGLAQLLQTIYTPGSPLYHHYVTASDFQQRFSPTPTQIQAVVAFLHIQGIAVGSVAPNGLLIDATTTVSLAQQVFQTQINTYQYLNQTFYANAQPPTVPLPLQPLLSSIGGLDNAFQYHPLALQTRQTRQKAATPAGYGPPELTDAYDTTPLASANIHGENQTIALFELDGYRPGDIQQYTRQYNLATPALSNVLVDHYNGAAGQGSVEVELDIELIAALAPKAQQLIYEGPNTTQGLNDTYNRIVTDNKAQILSISWGLCESSTGVAELQTLDTIFQQAAVQGISVFAAAGDTGAYDCSDGNLAVDSPADDPYVTGVGGTNLQLGANNSYGSESAWSDATDTSRAPQGSGGGGGISDAFGLPSWQLGNGVISSYSSGKPCNAPTGQYCREVPDVSANADPASGYAIYCTVINAGCNANGWVEVGGTSAATPLWAASTALVNQDLQDQKLGRVGLLNPDLYNLANGSSASPPFHDITTGNNLYYPANSGYDMATGLGSPDVSNLASDLAGGIGNNTPIPVPTDVPTPTSTPTPSQLIVNGGFENGAQAWHESSDGGYELLSNDKPHTGNFSAYLCGYTDCNDHLWQTFTVPTSYSSLTLTYWWYSDTVQTNQQCIDTLTAVIQTSSGKSIHTIQRTCNTNASHSWKQKTGDLTAFLAPYKGQQISLSFSTTSQPNSVLTTDFYLDDINLLAS